MVRRRVVVAAGLLLVTGLGVPIAGSHMGASQQSPPVLRTGVDLVTIDVQVGSVKGATLRELTAADFEVTVSGRRRKAASATFMHYDEGTVVRKSTMLSADRPAPDCVFGFHPTEDRKTAHYVLGIDRTDADQKEVKGVHVSITDKAFAVQFYSWRSPIPRSDSPRVAGSAR